MGAGPDARVGNNRDVRPLAIAAQAGHADVCEFLISDHMNAAEDAQQPFTSTLDRDVIQIARAAGHIRVIKILKAAKTEGEGKGKTQTRATESSEQRQRQEEGPNPE